MGGRREWGKEWVECGWEKRRTGRGSVARFIVAVVVTVDDNIDDDDIGVDANLMLLMLMMLIYKQ